MARMLPRREAKVNRHWSEFAVAGRGPSPCGMHLGLLRASAKSNRVAQRLGRQHAVLPLPANRALHDINRTRLELEQHRRVTRGVWIEGTKAHPPPSCQGKTDDHAIDRLVTMPADRCTGAVFAHQRMTKGRGIDRQPLCDSLLQLDKGLRQWAA